MIERFTVSPTRQIEIHHQHIKQFERDVVKMLEKLHDDHPRDLHFPPSQLEAKFRFLGDRAMLKAVLAQLAVQNIICLTARGVALPHRGPQLSQKEAELFEQIVRQYREAGFRPPSVDEIQAETTHHRQTVPQLIELAEAQGRLVRLNDSLYLHTEVEEAIRSRLRTRFGSGEGFTVSGMREELDISRKYAVPICEYLDRAGFTQRDRDLRVIIETEEAPSAKPTGS
jgi:selenocysteine-specific elongation factor